MLSPATAAMPAMLQKLFRSFFNTFVYIWTFIKALLSLSSPVESSTIVPYTLELDLESGSQKRKRRARAQKIVISRPFNSSASSLSVVDTELAPHEDPLRDKDPIEPPGLATQYDAVPSVQSVSPGSVAHHRESSAQPQTPSDEGCNGLPPTEVPRVEVETVDPDQLVRTSHDSSIDLSPVLNAKPLPPPEPHRTDYTLRGDDLPPFMSSFCPATPTKSQKSGKGHRRTTCTFLALPPLPPVEDMEGSQSLYSPVASLDPAKFSDQDPCPTSSISNQNAVNWSSTCPILSQPSIAKLSRAAVRDRPSGLHLPAKSEVSTALIQTIRDAFIRTREDESSTNEGKGARKLLDRASFSTCAQLSINSSNSSTFSVKQLASGCELKHAFGTQPSAFKFPSHKYLNSLSHAALGSEIVNSLSSHTINGRGRPVRWSADLSNSRVSTPGCSVDSGLDDILVSFEHLMKVMPNVQGSLVKHETASMSAPRAQGDALEKIDEGCVP